MSGFKILGESSLIKPDDEIEMIDEITMYDFVTLERKETNQVLMRVVTPKEYSTFSGVLYLIDKDNEGSIQLRQAQINLWPWQEK